MKLSELLQPIFRAYGVDEILFDSENYDSFCDEIDDVQGAELANSYKKLVSIRKLTDFIGEVINEENELAFIAKVVDKEAQS